MGGSFGKPLTLGLPVRNTAVLEQDRGAVA